MPINEAYQNNFEVLNQAARNGDLALIETKDAFSGKTVIVVCAHYVQHDEHVFVPVAKMFDGNPYEELISPQDPRFEATVEKPILRVFSRRFEGVYPVGAVAQVAAVDAGQAAKLLNAELEARGLRQSDPITADSMILFAPGEPAVDILLDGDY